MKKLILFLSISLVAFATYAQSTSPRFGTTSTRDNTGRVLTYAYSSVSDAAGNDTINIAPKHYETIYRLTVADSAVINITPLTNSFVGDKIYFVASGASGKKVKFYTTNLLTAGTITTSSNARASIIFIFDGTKWVEISRVAQ